MDKDEKLRLLVSRALSCLQASVTHVEGKWKVPRSAKPGATFVRERTGNPY